MKRPLILVVDDEPVVLRALRVALEAQDYVVAAVLTGEDALGRITNGAFDLVLLDLGLPGLEWLRGDPPSARAVYPGLPIIVLSAQGEDAVEGRGARPGRRRLRLQALLGAGVAGPHPRGAAPRRGRRRARRIRRTSSAESVSTRSRRAHRAGARRARAARHARSSRCWPASRGIPGRLLTHRAIVAEVWGDPDAAAADNLRVQISQLRRRIEWTPAPGADRDRARARLPLPRRTRRRLSTARGPGPLGQEWVRAVRVRRGSGAQCQAPSRLCTIRSISLMPTNGRITPPAP